MRVELAVPVLLTAAHVALCVALWHLLAHRAAAATVAATGGKGVDRAVPVARITLHHSCKATMATRAIRVPDAGMSLLVTASDHTLKFTWGVDVGQQTGTWQVGVGVSGTPFVRLPNNASDIVFVLRIDPDDADRFYRSSDTMVLTIHALFARGDGGAVTNNLLLGDMRFRQRP